MKNIKKIRILGIIILISLVVTSCLAGETTVMTVDGEEISNSMYSTNYKINYLELIDINEFDVGSEEYLEDFSNYIEEITDYDMAHIILAKNKLEEIGEETPEEEIKEYYDDYILELSKEVNIKELLKELKVTDEEMKNYVETLLYRNKLYENYMEENEKTEEELKEYFEENKKDLTRYTLAYVYSESREELEELEENLKIGLTLNSATMGKDNITYVKNSDIGEDIPFKNLFEEFQEAIINNQNDEMKYGNYTNIFEVDGFYYILNIIEKKDNYEDLKDIINEDIIYYNYLDQVDKDLEKMKIEDEYEKEELIETTNKILVIEALNS